MSARIWTREELDRVHPLPDGWGWKRDALTGSWVAVALDDGDEWEAGDTVGICGGAVHLETASDFDPPPAHVALAVILASQGLDSREAMAAEFERRAKDNRARAERAFTASMEIRQEGMADALDEAAAMLRRGRLQP